MLESAGYLLDICWWNHSSKAQILILFVAKLINVDKMWLCFHTYWPLTCCEPHLCSGSCILVIMVKLTRSSTRFWLSSRLLTGRLQPASCRNSQLSSRTPRSSSKDLASEIWSSAGKRSKAVCSFHESVDLRRTYPIDLLGEVAPGGHVADSEGAVWRVVEQTLVKAGGKETKTRTAVNQTQRQQTAHVEVQIIPESWGARKKNVCTAERCNNCTLQGPQALTLSVQSQVLGSTRTLKHHRVLDLLVQQLQEVLSGCVCVLHDAGGPSLLHIVEPGPRRRTGDEECQRIKKS